VTWPDRLTTGRIFRRAGLPALNHYGAEIEAVTEEGKVDVKNDRFGEEHIIAVL